MNTLAGISSDITTVSGISANVTAVATNAVKYTWSNSTTMGDPGSGAIRFNNATVGSVSAIAIDDSDSGGDIAAFLNSWDDSTNTNKGTLTIRKGGAAGTFAIFTLTALTDNSGWSQLAVTHVVSNGTWSNADIAFVEFARSGDKGADGDDASEVFKTISVSGQDDIVADGATDTLTLVAGEGVDITTTAGTDSITFAGEDSSVTNKGLVELATTAETTSGSDTDRAITPAGLHGGIAGLSDATITSSDKLAFVDVGSSDALKTDTVQGILDLAGSGAMSVLGTGTFSGSETGITLTGFSTDYDTYLITLSDIRPVQDNKDLRMWLGTSGGLLTTDEYSNLNSNLYEGMGGTTFASSSYSGTINQRINLAGMGNDADYGGGGVIWLHFPTDPVGNNMYSGQFSYMSFDDKYYQSWFAGGLDEDYDITQVKIGWQSGEGANGRATLLGIKHA